MLGNPPYIRQEELAPAFKNHLKTGYDTAAGTADLYVYFYEQGLRLLAPGGELSFITNNKWLRAGYGQGLRRYLLQPERQLVELLDFGDLPVFPEATTYPNILSVCRAPQAATVRVAELTTLGTDPTRFEAVVEAATTDMPTARLSEEAWSLAAAEQQQLLEKLRGAGTPLGEYVGGKIYNGVKTGFNEAFVIDAATREALIADDPKSVGFIKPFLSGRDVKRYRQPASNTFLLYIDWKFELDKFPAIKTHLLQYQEQLSARSEVKKGNYPWYALERARPEIKAIFEQPKIMIANFSQNAPYTIDKQGYFSNNKTTIIPLNDNFLVGVLNSRPTDFCYKAIGATKANGYYEYLPINLSQLPIPAATPEQQAEIAALVEQVLAAKAAAPTADTTALEQQIDALVAGLYGLTPQETALLTA
ncbi:Eco57I restriction-modification methylase domain-containing protein [Hymenobacter sp. J193]|nr:TaqI-like C-terminal specificity domain-containing protein [Hymenobacter sp. J193]MCR5886563.1 Eco57I restriction-modification methylase domain-containing protein [Hymenobacter sp. J193]